jgi:glycosyltransferase involved in cell wall biosynthesis
VVRCGLEPAQYGRDGDVAPPAATGARLVTVGRLVAVKGQLLLIDAVHALRARGLDVRAEIIGEGPCRADLERRIHELELDGSVTLVGAVGQDEVPARLRGATAFLLPSFAEGVPVVAMEAMALGVPVITSRVAGIPELIEDGVSGLLTTPSWRRPSG